MVSAISVTIAIGYMAYIGAVGSWQYYLSVDETVADATNLIGSRVRVSGRVGAGSLRVGVNRQDATFKLTGSAHSLHAICRCAMPDNLAEEVDVVVEGVLHADGIHGHKVITRCASKYQQEVVVSEHRSPGDAIAR
jgi:cytochrome c-type biogenesis protein CcmE